MLNRNTRLVSRIERLGDNLVVFVSFLAAYYGRGSLLEWSEALGIALPFSGEELAPIGEYTVVLAAALVIYNLALSASGAYRSGAFLSSGRVLKITSAASLAAFIGIASVLFVLKIDLSRTVVGLFCLLVALALASERFLLKRFLRYWLRKKIYLRNVVICGTGAQALKIAKEIKSRPELGINLIGFAVLGPVQAGVVSNSSGPVDLQTMIGELQENELIRGTQSLENVLKKSAVDEVVFTDIASCLDEAKEALMICGELGVVTTIAADLFGVGLANSRVSYFNGIPLIHFEPPPGDRWELSIKRLLDIILSIAGLIVLSPFFLLIGIVIKATSPGPIIFKQKRVGLNGRIFSMYKFRSMVEDAEKNIVQLRDKNEMSGPVFKMKEDPRVTPVGRFLRRYSFDELPQLWNVLRGDMSLVGPRPPVPSEVDEYMRKYRRRLSVRPGLTCTWQVAGRNNIKDFDSWMKLDLDYIDNWSLQGDLAILVKTVPAVIKGAGAR